MWKYLLILILKVYNFYHEVFGKRNGLRTKNSGNSKSVFRSKEEKALISGSRKTPVQEGYDDGTHFLQPQKSTRINFQLSCHIPQCRRWDDSKWCKDVALKHQII